LVGAVLKTKENVSFVIVRKINEKQQLCWEKNWHLSCKMISNTPIIYNRRPIFKLKELHSTSI
jgi:hypothetical protein